MISIDPAHRSGTLDGPMSWFEVLTLGGWLTIVSTAFALRSRPFATFVGVILGVYSLAAAGIAPAFRSIMPVFTAFF